MGSFLGITAAAADPAVRAVVLAAGGDLPPNTPFASLIRTVADPPRAARAFAGRPLLMISGKRDRTVTPYQAEQLFAAAGEPKTMMRTPRRSQRANAREMCASTFASSTSGPTILRSEGRKT